MDFKTGKLHKIIREFEKGNGRYEINGVGLKNTVFLYREKAGAFIPIPKGNYKTIFNDNESILEVDDVINNKAIEFQIISVFDVQSYKYLEKYPELKMVVVQTNKIVDDINNIIGYLNSVGVKTDSKYQTQILTPLEPLSVWYMNAEGLIDTLPIDDFNKKFKEIIEKMSELADEKAQEQVKKRLDELKTEIENFKNKKISEVLKELKIEKDNSIKEIEKIKEKSKSELNSRMPEINNKFNGIAGGTINPTFIQDDGEKTEGQYYLDRPTGKLYRCIKTTSNAVNSAEYFKDMSLNSIVNILENLSKTKINITENVPKNLLELNALANTLLKFSNQDSFLGLKNFEILAKDGTFFMRISKTPSFYIFEVFLQVSKYFVGTWYRDSKLIFVQIS